MIDAACPHCLGEREIFDDEAEDWIPCAACKGTGKRDGGE